MFVKNFPKLTPSQIALLARHAKEINTALAKCDDVIFPEILGYDAISITYSTVNCDIPLSEIVKNLCCCSPEMYQIGKILRNIHSVHWTDKNSQGKKNLLHSDYVPHNLFLHNDKIVVIDPHPPENAIFCNRYLYGNRHLEIARFIFTLLTTLGLKRSIFHLGYLRRMANSFFQGYEKQHTGFLQLFFPTFLCAHEIYFLKRQVGFSRISSLMHCILGCILTYIIIAMAL